MQETGVLFVSVRQFTKGKKTINYGNRFFLVVLLVTLYCPDGHEGGDAYEGEHLMDDTVEVATTNEDGADGIGEVVHGVDVGGEVGPVGHGADGGEKARKQHQAHYEKPHHQHGLLHSVAVVGNDKAETAKKQR